MRMGKIVSRKPKKTRHGKQKKKQKTRRMTRRSIIQGGCYEVEAASGKEIGVQLLRTATVSSNNYECNSYFVQDLLVVI